MTQKEMIIRYLNEHGSINTWECFNKLFITRLSAYIYILKHKMNFEFEEERIEYTNIYGKKRWFKKYILKEGKTSEKSDNFSRNTNK